MIGKHLVGNVEGRIRWLELLKAINACLPRREDPKPDDQRQGRQGKDDVCGRRSCGLRNCTLRTSIARRSTILRRGSPPPRRCARRPPTPAAHRPLQRLPTPRRKIRPDAAPAKGPTWIIQIAGHHYHNANRDNQGAEYLTNTLIKALRKKKVELPSEDGKGTELVSMKELGISYPTIVKKSPLEEEPMVDPNSESPEGGGGGMMGMEGRPMAADGSSTAKTITPLRFDFVVQFCWQPKTPQERRKAKEAAEKAKKAAQAANNTAQP